MRLIGVGFRKRSGKDAVGEILRRRYGFTVMSFAAPLKAAAAAIFGFTDAQLYGEDKERTDPFWGFTPRWALQVLGTEGVRRAIRDDVWVASLERSLARVPAFVPGVIVTDVRFPNEADMLLRRGGKVIRVDRPGTEAGEHESERAMETYPGWSGVLRNDGTLADLEDRVDALMERGGFW